MSVPVQTLEEEVCVCVYLCMCRFPRGCNQTKVTSLGPNMDEEMHKKWRFRRLNVEERDRKAAHKC